MSRRTSIAALLLTMLSSARASSASDSNGSSAETSAPASSSAPFPAEASDAIDRAVAAAIAEGKLPGAVVVVGRKDSVLFARAYGYRALTPKREATTIDTVYDLASLTKPIATATSVMLLVDEGKVGLDDPIVRYLPELAHAGKDAITVRQLLLHTSGLVADTPVADSASNPLVKIAASRLVGTPGEVSRYSDAGFIVLGELVHRVSGVPLDTFAKTRIFEPLGMPDTTFLPPEEERARAALTEPLDNVWKRGVVHDPRARIAGGAMGHAGLFSTAQDLVLYAQALLSEGNTPKGQALPREAVRRMLAPHDVPEAVRALGWDVRSAYSTNRGKQLSPRAFGHGGYTGTSLWIDPEKDLFVLLLANRVHPDGKGAVNPLAGRIADLATLALVPELREASGKLETGIDVLVAEGFARLRGAHVALVTNASGKASTGARTLDLLRVAKGVSLRAVFAPEHGLASDKDERIGDGRDEASGLVVYSLYGDHFAPTDVSLEGIDTIVFDIQDAGSRFFTYSSTLKHMMQAAALRGLRLLVLDRPDPIDAVDVEGPVIAESRLARAGGGSFVNHHPLPVRHGMTMGELALLFDADLHLGTKLEIVKMRGYSRASFYDETGLPWTNPSPNLRSTDEALLYDGVGLLEGTNLSVGRGTDTPFEVVGAPYIDGDAWLAELQSSQVSSEVPGVRFAKATFSPTSSKFAGKPCAGVRIRVTDRHALNPVRLGLALALSLRKLYPTDWHVSELDRMILDKNVVAAVDRDEPLPSIEALWQGDLARFKTKRAKYLLY